MKKTRGENRRRLRERGVYIIPNLFTSCNLFCGFYAVILSIEGEFVAAAVSIICATVFDLLDGKIARATKTTTRFGLEYDSLADLVSFGLAPGLMMYMWALHPMGRLGWLAAFLFMACGALRLARFNIQTGHVDGRYFVGLPIPAAACINAVVILLFNRFGMHPPAIPVLIMLYVLAFLMVSTMKFNSFKKPKSVRRKINLNILVSALLILVFIAAEPSVALFILGMGYLISGPVTTLRLRSKKNREEKETPDRQTTVPCKE